MHLPCASVGPLPRQPLPSDVAAEAQGILLQGVQEPCHNVCVRLKGLLCVASMPLIRFI